MQHDFQQELLDFKREHPEVESLTPLMEVYHMHMGRRAKSIREAYDHVYGSSNPEGGCSWCKERMEKEKFWNAIDAAHGRWDVE